MSKEPVRRQWADDDEDDDREVNSILILLSTPLLHTICTSLLNTKNLEHQIQSQRGSNGTVKDRITFSVNAKNQKVVEMFVKIELLPSNLKKFLSVVFLILIGQDHYEISHSRSEN
jgi:hypothetical protein